MSALVATPQDSQSKPPSRSSAEDGAIVRSESDLENSPVSTPKRHSSDDVQILDWDGPDDPENPRNWPRHRKILATAAALLCTLIVPLNGTSITVAAEEINKEFDISDATFTNSYWPVLSWTFGGALFVLLFLPLIEDTGVRKGYLIFYSFFVLMIIPQALAPNFATLIVSRVFAGGCVALLSNTIASVIPDVWSGDAARSVPVSLFILFYLLGSTLGPPLFGGVAHHLSTWRWIFYIQLIIYATLLPFFFFCIRETRGPVILRHRAKRLRRSTGKPIYTHAELSDPPLLTTLPRSALRPLYLLTTEPVLLAATLWSAFSFGTVYLFTQSVGQVFTALYAWPAHTIAYVQAAVALGELLAWPLSFYSTHLYLRSAARNPESPAHPIPEARLYVSIPGSLLGVAGGMFVYAWTSFPGIPWPAPVVGLVLVGAGTQTVVLAAADYIEDCYAVSGYAGSAIGAAAAVENIVAGVLPLATSRMYGDLGFQWASSVIGFAALGLSLAPVVFIWKGRRLRERSPFMVSGGVTAPEAVKAGGA